MAGRDIERHCEACRYYQTQGCWGRIAGYDYCEHFTMLRGRMAEEKRTREQLQMPYPFIDTVVNYRRIEETDSDEEYWEQFEESLC